MADITVDRIIPLAHELVDSSTENLWLSYDREADVLYVSMHRLDVADDTEYRDDGVIVRYREDTVIGYTIPMFAKRYTPILRLG